MYRQGLILAGIVGGMVMFGGSALAAMPSAPTTEMAAWPQDDPDFDNRVIICGDDNIFSKEAVDKSTRGVLVLQTGDILSQILGIKSKDSKCVIS
ncbi:hypothetical protein [Nonomuraea glycinis]|jgi:hypothetical protein|uniref:hypothetical protein n=1 Tax=Nonomuraea glycinis TaxID=2047744 RepID=UPI002E1487CE|nr:hypothetical protein OHA68_03975 [Nonomuraea glycinis]